MIGDFMIREFMITKQFSASYGVTRYCVYSTKGFIFKDWDYKNSFETLDEARKYVINRIAADKEVHKEIIKVKDVDVSEFINKEV